MAESCEDLCGSEASEDSIIILEDMSNEESERHTLQTVGILEWHPHADIGL